MRIARPARRRAAGLDVGDGGRGQRREGPCADHLQALGLVEEGGRGRAPGTTPAIMSGRRARMTAKVSSESRSELAPRIAASGSGSATKRGHRSRVGWAPATINASRQAGVVGDREGAVLAHDQELRDLLAPAALGHALEARHDGGARRRGLLQRGVGRGQAEVSHDDLEPPRRRSRGRCPRGRRRKGGRAPGRPGPWRSARRARCPGPPRAPRPGGRAGPPASVASWGTV